MSSQVRHISCPACGGAVGVTNVDRIVKCAYCEAPLMVEHPDYLPRYAVTPDVDAVSARRVLQKFLTSRFLPGGLLKNARFLAATLCYVPFYDFRTRRIGTIETTVQRMSRTRMTVDFNAETSMGPVFTEKRETVPVRETEMVMGDIHRVEAATAPADFGLEYCSVYAYLKAKPRLQPFHSIVHQNDARVYPPTISADTIADQMQIKGFAGSVHDDTRYVESRTQIVYFPLWRLKYQFAGRLYSAVLDGMTGELLRVTAPEGDHLRVATLLFGVSILGMLGGVVLRSLSSANAQKTLSLMSDVSVGLPVMAVLLIIGCMPIFLWMLVWNQFRWPGEVCQLGSEIHVEKYNSLLKRRIRLPLLTVSSLLKILFEKKRT